MVPFKILRNVGITFIFPKDLLGRFKKTSVRLNIYEDRKVNDYANLDCSKKIFKFLYDKLSCWSQHQFQQERFFDLFELKKSKKKLRNLPCSCLCLQHIQYVKLLTFYSYSLYFFVENCNSEFNKWNAFAPSWGFSCR